MPSLEAFGHTDIGRVRATNQDSYLALDLEGRGPSRCLLVVADGMGGHSGGAVASEIAVTTLRESVQRRNQSIHALPVREVLEAAVRDANAAVLDAATRETSLKGMGTTLVVALIVGETACIANVGDSRAYLISEGAIRQITVDHVWELDPTVRDQFDEVQIAESPFRGMLTRSVGVGPDLTVDLFEADLAGGSHLLLCSDGVHRHVSSQLMLDTVVRGQDPERVCQDIISLANQAGGADNITCVVALVRGAGARPDPTATVRIATLPPPGDPTAPEGQET